MDRDNKNMIAIIGSLTDVDLIFGEILLRQGVEITVLRLQYEANPNLSLPFYSMLEQKHIRLFKTPLELLWTLQHYNFVYSITSALFFHLGKLAFFYPLLIRLGWPKYMVICSGSNITERAIEHSKAGILERFSLRHSFCNVANNYPYAIRNILHLGRGNWVFLPFPYPIYKEPCQPLRFQPNKPLIFFHPSHLDWGETDNKPGRTSTKGNDRFIKAFIRACKKGLNANCVMLDRGPDKDNAKKLITELGGEKFFTWKPQLSREELHKEMLNCDVVVDQFDIGGYGGISVEAMNHGKPVMIYIHPVCNSLTYGNEVPVINVYTENEIEQALMQCQKREYLDLLAQKGREWIARYMDPEVIGRKYLFYAELAMRRNLNDYGWNRNPI